PHMHGRIVAVAGQQSLPPVFGGGGGGSFVGHGALSSPVPREALGTLRLLRRPSTSGQHHRVAPLSPRTVNHMSEEFPNLGPNTVRSVKGFTVALDLLGGVKYSDATGTTNVDTDSLITPPKYGVVLYTTSVGLANMPTARAEEIISNIMRAVEYLGYEVVRH